MDRAVQIAGTTYESVPSVTIPTTGGGEASFVEISDTTALAADVASGKFFYTADGIKTQGTASGGGGVQSGSFTPTERVATITFDCGISNLNGLAIFPHSETPVKSGGRTFIFGICINDVLWPTMFASTNNAGSSATGVHLSSKIAYQYETGTEITVNPSVAGSGAFETVRYDWLAW